MLAAAEQWVAHPPEFYADARRVWSAERPAHAAELVRLDVAVADVCGSDAPALPPYMLLVLRQQETQTLALAWLRYARAHGKPRLERAAVLAAMASWVQFAARAGVQGCPLTGPVTLPLLRGQGLGAWRRFT